MTDEIGGLRPLDPPELVGGHAPPDLPASTITSLRVTLNMDYEIANLCFVSDLWYLVYGAGYVVYIYIYI